MLRKRIHPRLSEITKHMSNTSESETSRKLSRTIRAPMIPRLSEIIGKEMKINYSQTSRNHQNRSIADFQKMPAPPCIDLPKGGFERDSKRNVEITNSHLLALCNRGTEMPWLGCLVIAWLSCLITARYVNTAAGLSSHGLVFLFIHGAVC